MSMEIPMLKIILKKVEKNLGTHLKMIKYGMDNICAKFGEFARIWTKRSLFLPGAPHYIDHRAYKSAIWSI